MRTVGMVQCKEENIFQLSFKHNILKPLRHMCINIILLTWRVFEQLHLVGVGGKRTTQAETHTHSDDREVPRRDTI
jgi:hypothetical protein